MGNADHPDKGRRAALIRLGLGAVVAYVAPALTTLSQAHASSGSGGGSGGSGGGDGGGDGGGASGASGAGGAGQSAGGASGASAGESAGESAGVSAGASNASAATGASDSDAATISFRDQRRAQKAVREGRALPLNKVLQMLHDSLGGDLISVRYRESKSANRYIFKVVSDDGRLMEINVDAQTAQVIGAGS